MTPHILVVEDERHIAQGLVFNLQLEGYRVTHVENGEGAIGLLETRPDVDLVVLDLMLPGVDGFEVCRWIRSRDAKLPVLMLTARSEAEDRVKGLASGADDYLSKPFHLEEFLLRVRRMLDRAAWYQAGAPARGEVRFGDNRVDLEGLRAVTPRGEVELTDLEVKMLGAFVEREGLVVSRGTLLEQVWGVSPDAETRTLDNFIVRLRRYFEPDPAHPVHFLTVRGVGYRFVREPGQGVTVRRKE